MTANRPYRVHLLINNLVEELGMGYLEGAALTCLIWAAGRSDADAVAALRDAAVYATRQADRLEDGSEFIWSIPDEQAP